MPSFADHLQAVRAAIREISPSDLAERLLRGDVTLIDVREPTETDSGTIAGAHCLGRPFLESRLAQLQADADAPVVVFCAAGARSALAAKSLIDMGYRDVQSLAGGVQAWQAAGLPLVAPGGLTAAQKLRYGRHLLLPEVGEAGHLRLLKSRVLIVGLGGLGSPVALYLAAAGVGTLGLCDGDVVDVSNLQRQVIHSTARLGERKVESARQALTALNPEVAIDLHPVRITADNALELVARYDVVVDACDNFATRYLLNDACHLAKKPNIHGSIHRFQGSCTVLWTARGGPCYRCLFPQPPPPEAFGSCTDNGVLGVLPGLVGLMQATEVLKVLLDIGEPLVGRLAIHDALAGRTRHITMRRDHGCALCGDHPTLDRLSDDQPACAR
ncbi:MAG: molybdopterin-synthase adenylyltransferase MoeB [Deltaproteobacteria bacterium]|nr:molybdopterin-synthase adenylyltransferase MoeB [Deltaproteobacteria bacterium]